MGEQPENVALGCDGQPIAATLRQWVEAIEALPDTSWRDAALWNGGCISDDLKVAAAEIERLRAPFANLDSLDWDYLERLLINAVRHQQDSQTRVWVDAVKALRAVLYSHKRGGDK